MLIYYFSGTGNSLKAARDIAAKCGGRVKSMRTAARFETGEDAVGFVFPVYCGGVPRAVAEFIRKSRFDAEYFFAVVTYGGTAGRSLGHAAHLLAEKGCRLDYGAGVRAFPNYIAKYYFPFNPLKTAARQDKKVAAVAEAVKGRAENRIAPKPVNIKSLAGLDAEFSVSPNCTSCGLCAKLCPAGNITLAGRQPQFKHKCEQCMACVQWCPNSAINTPKTHKRKRYRHPDITVGDLTR
jgi:ferredoxin